MEEQKLESASESAGEATAEKKQPHRRKLVGRVVSVKTEKTALVLVERSMIHKRYKKKLKRSKRYMVHDEKNELKLGYLVEIIEARPMSARKRFALSRILESNDLLHKKNVR